MSEAFGVNGIPSLVLLTGAGEEITREGRDAVGYGVAHFPWGEAERKAGAAAAEKAEEERAAEGKRKEEEMAEAEPARSEEFSWNRITNFNSSSQ